TVLVLAVLLVFQVRDARQRSEELQQVVTFQAEMLQKISVADAGQLLTAAVNARIGDGDEAEGLQRLWRQVNAIDVARDLLGELVLEPAASTVDQQFPAQPRVQARLFQVLATSYRNLGLYEEGLQLQQRAWVIRRDTLGERHLDTVEALHD